LTSPPRLLWAAYRQMQGFAGSASSRKRVAGQPDSTDRFCFTQNLHRFECRWRNTLAGHGGA